VATPTSKNISQGNNLPKCSRKEDATFKEIERVAFIYRYTAEQLSAL